MSLSGTTPSSERLAIDPIHHHASQVAKGILTRVSNHENAIPDLQEQVDRYRSSGQRMRFLDAFRIELTSEIDRHRLRCPEKIDPSKCPQERRYAQLITAVSDELEMINPAIAARSLGMGFTTLQADRVNQVLNELMANLNGVQQDISLLKNGQQLIYEDAVEAIEEMRDKLPYGKRDWYDLFVQRVANLTLEEGLKRELVDPALQAISEALA